VRLQLMRVVAVALCAGLFAAHHARAAEDTAAVRLDVYTDEALTVINQSGSAALVSPEGVRARGHYAVDAISGATRVLRVDAVTSATHFEETRLEGGAGLGADLPAGQRLDVGYTTSHEPDYLTHALVGALGADLFDKRVTATVSIGLSLEQVGSVQDKSFRENTWGVALDGAWAHVLTPGTALTLLATASAVRCGDTIGCHASPYRFAAVRIHDDTEGEDVILALRERHPTARARGAAAARLSQSVTKGIALHGGYRGYADSWGIVGHTADAALASGFFADRLVLRAEARAAMQSAASFQNVVYGLDGAGHLPGVRTADRELGALSDVMLGGRALLALPALGPFRTLSISARVARVFYRYQDTPDLPRDAWLAGVGIGARLP
jgi:Protein of unknown function (DUF3570)